MQVSKRLKKKKECFVPTGHKVDFIVPSGTNKSIF